MLRLLAEGRSDAEIARALQLSERTVHDHVRHILHKLKSPNRTTAALYWERYTHRR